MKKVLLFPFYFRRKAVINPQAIHILYGVVGATSFGIEKPAQKVKKSAKGKIVAVTSIGANDSLISVRVVPCRLA